MAMDPRRTTSRSELWLGDGWAAWCPRPSQDPLVRTLSIPVPLVDTDIICSIIIIYIAQNGNTLWIHTFVPGLPLSFLDRNLVIGDALNGIGTLDEIKANEQVIEAYLGTGLKNKEAVGG